MSLVVAYKKDGTVYMGADTQSSRGSEISRTLNASGFKISKLPSGILMGVCGLVKGHQKILTQKNWFELPEGKKLDKRYIVKNIIPKLSELMKGIKEDKDARHSSMEVCLLLAQADRLFMISNQYTVFESHSYAAIGAGADYSEYCLSRAEEADDVHEGLLKALRAGAHFDSTVSAPYVLIDTKDREYAVVEG